MTDAPLDPFELNGAKGGNAHRCKCLLVACSAFAPLLLAACSVQAGGDQRAHAKSRFGPADPLAASLVAAGIRQSRNQALADGARPIPERLRPALERHFAPEMLDEVRWTVASDRLGIDTLAVRTRPRFEAITLDDVIVFRDIPTSRDLKIWIHELLHVRQVRSVGLREFASQYVVRSDEIEAATRAQTDAVFKLIAKEPGR